MELTYAGQEVAVRDTVNTDFENEYQQVNIHLTKFMEHDESFGIGENGEYKNVSFGLYTAEKMTAADGSSVPADSLIDVAGLHEDMTAAFDAKLPFGKYYIQEIATDEHYIINGEKYLVTYEYAGQDIECVDIDCGTFTNDIIRGSVKGMKINELGEPLSGATFGLFKADTETFDAASAILTSTSDENGSFGFDDVPYGKYIVTEIAPSTGYVLSDERFDVIISENEQVIEITAENTPTQLTVSKRDIYGAELPGASMQIIDSEGNVFDEWISDGLEHIVTHIPAGTYTLKEIASPDGFVIATEIIFTIDLYNTVTTENTNAVSVDTDGKPTITMVDDTTKVHISKRDITTDKELPGAKLQILDGDTVIEEWVSTEEEYIIEGKLIAGKEYILREITAPDGYEVANDVTFKVSEDGSVDHVVMYDEHKPEEEKPHEDTPHNDTPHSSTPSSGGGGTANPHTGAPEVSNKAAIILACAGLLLVVSMFIRKDEDKENGEN